MHSTCFQKICAGVVAQHATNMKWSSGKVWIVTETLFQYKREKTSGCRYTVIVSPGRGPSSIHSLRTSFSASIFSNITRS